MKKWASVLRLAPFIDRPHQEKPGSPKQCLHSCQAATHTQTLAYITVRYWRSADTNTPKQKPEAYVTPSVLTQAKTPHTIPTWEAPLEKKVSETFLRVICAAAACGCLCAFCMWRAWSERPYKGSQQRHQACQLQQTAAFQSDKSQPPTHAPSMPPCMPPSRACSKKTFLPVTEPWP